MASFLFCYHLRLDRMPENNLSYADFMNYLNNLPPESQLSRVIRIRTAKDEELENLTDEQKALRERWIEKHKPREEVERDKNRKFDDFMEHLFGRR